MSYFTCMGFPYVYFVDLYMYGLSIHHMDGSLVDCMHNDQMHLSNISVTVVSYSRQASQKSITVYILVYSYSYEVKLNYLESIIPGKCIPSMPGFSCKDFSTL